VKNLNPLEYPLKPQAPDIGFLNQLANTPSTYLWLNNEKHIRYSELTKNHSDEKIREILTEIKTINKLIRGLEERKSQ
jgi:hypothetical protein